MFVFAETRGESWLELQNVSAKEELPFEELVVVAGRIGGDSRQLTCISARVKPWGRRLLFVLPVPVPAASSDEATVVQILDVGEVAVQFVQDVRGCFPTLVRRNPMSSAPDSDDESGDDEDDDDGANAKRRLEKEEAKHREEQRQQQQQDARTREAVAYMDRARIKMLTSLDELFHAFQILKHAQVHSALQRDASTHSGTCQWLCIDLPAAQPSPSSAATNGTGAASIVHNVGVMFSHAVASPEDAQFLRIPLPRTPNGFFSSDDDGSTQDGEGDSATEIFQDATVLSFGAKREATAHGGGKTPDEMVRNIRMRHASGTFCSLVNPETTWGEVAAKYTTFLPQVHEIHGDLRVRRIMGPAANESVAFLLEK